MAVFFDAKPHATPWNYDAIASDIRPNRMPKPVIGNAGLRSKHASLNRPSQEIQWHPLIDIIQRKPLLSGEPHFPLIVVDGFIGLVVRVVQHLWPIGRHLGLVAVVAGSA